MIPRDESDEHSAVLELRAGMCTVNTWIDGRVFIKLSFEPSGRWRRVLIVHF